MAKPYYQVGLQLSEDQYKILDRLAKKAGMRRGPYLKQLILRAAGKATEAKEDNAVREFFKG